MLDAALLRFALAVLGLLHPGLAVRAASADEGAAADVDALAGILAAGKER